MIVTIKGQKVYLPIRLRTPDRLTTLAVVNEIGVLTDADVEQECLIFYGVEVEGETLVFSASETTT